MRTQQVVKEIALKLRTQLNLIVLNSVSDFSYMLSFAVFVVLQLPFITECSAVLLLTTQRE